MEKLNPIKRQFPRNKSAQEMNSRTLTQVQQYSQAKTVFLEKGRSFFLYIAFSFQSYYMESTSIAVYGIRTVPRRTFPRWTFPRRTVNGRHFPDGQFSSGQFPEEQFPEQTIPRTDISLADSSPNDISPNHISQITSKKVINMN